MALNMYIKLMNCKKCSRFFHIKSKFPKCSYGKAKVHKCMNFLLDMLLIRY